MTDIFSKDKRSDIMSKISNKNTKPEILVRKYLFANGFRFRVNDKRFPGKPDILLPKYKTAIFVNGCFWHGHKNCKAATLPSSNTDYWANKIASNIERDKKAQIQLEQMGYRVFIIWQCQLKAKERECTLSNLAEKLIDKNRNISKQ
ncbi:very short patch repair endonuclease [Bacteroides pyogenes]|uniref:Very short patch repair endonuclease n=2 Tax=Bacteroides pyogenes TaxID=310300 RepID=W4PI56_9BACE|nr:DNA mismatch endonuclease Vsr [Bacteroides pyogenes]GAE16640.1 very-short-patch mismatch repair endonuclease [Bacteroides pyogenes JCM 6292]GAE19103.1 very-short-patch mismatch repair endonuclease [Bacteroides pyogenes DSM 20611 = JCM 6294]